MDAERLKSSQSTTYPYPAVDDTAQDLDRRPEAEKREWSHRQIERTDSMEWGTGEIATLRAGLEPNTTKDNERLLRTHHRSLTKASVVIIATSPFGKPIWLVSCNVPDIAAGGLDIHLFPAGYPMTQMIIPTSAVRTVLAQSLVRGQINPRKFLTAQDLESLRILFPRAIGAQLLMAGFLRILFRNSADVESSNKLGYLGEVGGLAVLLDTAEFSATAQNIESGTALIGPEAKPIGCLGLKLKLPGESRTVITAVTHAFVRTPVLPAVVMRVADWVVRAKKAICKFWNPHLDKDSRFSDYGTLSNTPVGKEITLMKTNSKIGAVTRCYDNPSPILPYPAGYRHDLVLIEGDTLPEVVSPPGYPIISTWARYEEVLAGAPLYAVALNTQTHNWRATDEAKLVPAMANSVLLWSEYIWEREANNQSVSMLWRSQDGVDSATGYFGSVLCAGTPTDQCGAAVVFKNYETGLRLWEFDGTSSLASIKAGFLLPGEIRESTIVAPVQN